MAQRESLVRHRDEELDKEERIAIRGEIAAIDYRLAGLGSQRGNKNDGEELMTASAGKRLEGLLAPILRRVTTICGSKLAPSQVACFPKQRLPSAHLSTRVASISPSSKDCKYVYQKVLAYTEGMVTNARQNRIDEVGYVQTPTFELIRTLVTHLLPDVEMQFFEKNQEGSAVDIAYAIELQTPDGTLHVKGQTDQVIAVGDVPYGNIEVKDLNMTCESQEELGQILAEAKGLAERHRVITRIEPYIFPSLLVSGRRWAFVDRTFGNGDEQYQVFPALETFGEVTAKGVRKYKVNESNVLMVSRMLIRMTRVIDRLIRAAAKKSDEYGAIDRADCDSEEGRDRGDLSDRGEDPEGPVKGPAARGTKRGPAPPANTSNNKNRGSNKKARGADGKGKQSKLTMANMFRHDLNTMWQRTAV